MRTQRILIACIGVLGLSWCAERAAADSAAPVRRRTSVERPYGLGVGVYLPVSGVCARVGKKYVLTGTFDTKIVTRGKGPKCKVKTDKKTGELVCTVKLKAKWLVEDCKTDQVDLNTYCTGFLLTPYGW